MIFSLIVAAGLCVGLMRYKNQQHGIRLWYPDDGEAFHDVERLDQYFTLQGYEEDFTIVAPPGVNVISLQVSLYVSQMITEILAIKTKNNHTFNDICIQVQPSTCAVVTPLQFIPEATPWEFQSAFLQAYGDPTQLMANGRPAIINFPALLGSLVINQTSQTMSATAIRTTFPIYAARNSKMYDMNSEVEDSYRDIMKKWKVVLSEKNYQLVWLTSSGQDKSITDNSGEDVIWSR